MGPTPVTRPWAQTSKLSSTHPQPFSWAPAQEDCSDSASVREQEQVPSRQRTRQGVIEPVGRIEAIGEAEMSTAEGGSRPRLNHSADTKKLRRYFIGGSDARIIMGTDEAALVRLWREKRGEVEPEDLSGNLMVQLGRATEDLNRHWYEANTGQVITDIQKQVWHPALCWMAATLDGRVQGSDAVFEAKFMLPWSFSEEAAAEKYMPQLQHNMWVVAARTAVLSVITGGGKWVEIATHADPLYQHLIVNAERKFWRCVETGEPPRLFGAESPKPRIQALRVVDMSGSNSWAEFAGLFRSTREAFLEHERSKVELKALMPEDAKEAIGHGIRAKRSKSGAISLDLLAVECSARVRPLALSPLLWPRRRPSWSTPKNPWWQPSGPMVLAAQNDHSATPRCRAVSTSSARP
jgi:predicted phage-related endonuclease